MKIKAITITKDAAKLLGVEDLMVTSEEVDFLQESNNIEDVWDEQSLLQACYAWSHLKQQKELTTGVVLKTHKILMLHQPLYPNEKGYFRTCPVWIGGREGLDYKKIREAMDTWLAIMNAKDIDFPEEWAKQSHVQYERIHPFVDGNGRTGRMFMNWFRLKHNLPVLVIKESEKWDYYQWFQ